MEKTFKFYSDPGHSWLAVKRKLLIDLNILDKITRFSYQKGQTVYLEEDCDVTTFFKAFSDHYGIVPQTTEKKHYDNSCPIRSYQSFNPQN